MTYTMTLSTGAALTGTPFSLDSSGPSLIIKAFTNTDAKIYTLLYIAKLTADNTY